MGFYGTLEPPAPSPPVPQNNGSILSIKSPTRKGTEPAEVRYGRAHHAVWPILYPDPEELPIVVDKLLHWIGAWVTYIEGYPGWVNVEYFRTAILGKLVGVHPSMAGNKRTASATFGRNDCGQVGHHDIHLRLDETGHAPP